MNQIFVAEKFVKDNGLPICDFKIYERVTSSPLVRFKRCVNYIMVLNKLNAKAKNTWKWMINRILKKDIKIDSLDKSSNAE